MVFVNDLEEVPEGSICSFPPTASRRQIRQQSDARKLKTIDATCPLVTKVHREAIRFARDGYTIILIGHAGHDEVIGTMGEAPEAFRLVQTVEDADRARNRQSRAAGLSHADDAFGDETARDHRQAAGAVSPDCRAEEGRHLLCHAESAGGRADSRAEADVLLVVGSHNSSNSRRLAELARAGGVPSHLIDGPDDIDLGWSPGRRDGADHGRRRRRRTLCKSASPCWKNASMPQSRRAPWCASRFALSCPSRCAARGNERPAMKINDLEFHLVEIGCTGRTEPVRSLLVRLTTDSGLEGWGESALRWRVGELAARRDALLPLLAGRSIFDIEELHALGALPPAPLRAAVEMACWDLMGQAVGQPLCRLLGGEYRRRIPLAVRLSERKPERLAQLARELAAQGFRSQVVGATGDAALDRQMLHAVRESVGDGIELRLDGLARYGIEMARNLCARSNWTTCNFFWIRWHRGRFSRWPG